MRGSLIIQFLAISASAAPLEDALSLGDRDIEARALNCAPLRVTPVVDTFDDRKVNPLIPEANALLLPPPNGTYINYTQMAYAYVGTSLNVNVPSKDNDIYVIPSINNAVLKPAFNGANAFQLRSFRYVCLTTTAETLFDIPATCTFTVSCDVWGLSGPASSTVSQTITYNSGGIANLFSINFGTANFPATFDSLSQCTIKVTQSSPFAGFVPPVSGNFLTVLAIDNVSNLGEFCVTL